MRTYPRWLNLVTWPILASIPMGLLVGAFVNSTAGAAILFFGFLGLWIFGTLASRLGRNDE